jgi:hypothetical protein
MNRRTLNSIEEEIARLRAGAPDTGELVSLTIRLGRVRPPRLRKRGKGGGHQTFVSKHFPDLRPLQIPMHGSGQIKKFTARGILAQLEADDVARWRRTFEAGGVNGEER